MRRLFLLLALVLLGTPLLAQSVVNYHTTLFDHLDPVASGPGFRYSALTGYTAPDGREYAIVGGHDGTYIVDITVKPIKLISFIPGSPSLWREMKTYSHYAYVVTETPTPYPGLQIIDLANLPASAELVAQDSTWFRTAHTITQEGDYLYINGTNADAGANGGTMIFKISDDPVHPQAVSAYTTTYVHDCTVRNDTLYTAAIYNGELDITYLGPKRDKLEPIAEIRYPGGGTHNCDLTTDGTYVMTTDEVGETPKTLKVWDIHDRNDITKVADYTPAAGEIVHNVHIKGDLAFVSWYTAGTRILDISDPRDPAQIGYYDTFDGASMTMTGNWEVYPYLPSGKILAGDMVSGLYVFTFDGGTKGKIAGVVTDSATGAPIPNATLTFPKIGLTLTTDDSGLYSFSGAVDTLGVQIRATAYATRNDTAMLTPTGSRYDFKLHSFFSSVAADRDLAGGDAVSVEPNPISAAGTLKIRLAEHRQNVRAELFDDLGQRVALLHEGAADAGALLLPFDASRLPDGRYVWRVTGDVGSVRDGAVIVVH